MKTLVIDHYDSFTYNLVHMIATVNGEAPLVVRHDQVSWSDLAPLRIHNIVLSPGPGNPDHEGDFAVSRAALALARVPILGVCLGHQGMAAAFGGRVVRAPQPMHGRLSRVLHDGSDLFAGIPSPFRVVRYHSLLIGEMLPDGLAITARTEDGLPMALRHTQRPFWGVQFHPESILTEHGHTLLANFRDLTRAASPRLIPPVRLPDAETLRAEPPGPRPTAKAVWREIDQAIDAEAAFLALFADQPASFWLDSALVVKGRGRWSYLGAITQGKGRVLIQDTASGPVQRIDGSGIPIDSLSGSIFDALDQMQTGRPVNAPPIPFIGGAVGWLGYELHRICDGPDLPDRPRAATPAALFLRAERFLAIDHESGRTWVVANAADETEIAAAAQWVEAVSATLTDLPPTPLIATGRRRHTLRFHLDRDRATYLSDVQQSLDWIAAGETYQVCLTNELTIDGLGLDPLQIYRLQRRRNPAPHAAFLRWPGGAVLSASPERFLSVDASGLIQARPIKGTMKRSADPEADQALAARLAESEKDRAENLMIVDLLRNDLSRVSVPGSVTVPALMALETYATVHQLVSTIEGRLAQGCNALDAIRAAFPGGSMTGAPKHRTIALIDQLEQRARGIYSGGLGWVGDDGAADLSIVIRTIVAIGDQLSFGAGGGIVAQSTPEGEFDEMLLKAKGSIEAIVLAATGGCDPRDWVIEGAEPAPSGAVVRFARGGTAERP